MHTQATLNEAAIYLDLQGKVATWPADRAFRYERGEVLEDILPKGRDSGRYCLTDTVCL